MKRNALKILVATVAAAMIVIGLRMQDPPEQPRPPKKFGHDSPITRHGMLVWGPHGVVHDMAYHQLMNSVYHVAP